MKWLWDVVDMFVHLLFPLEDCLGIQNNAAKVGVVSVKYV